MTRRTTEHADDQRAVRHIRVSTHEQAAADKPLLEQQRQRIEAMCVAREFELVDVYQDVISGAKWERPGLQAILTDAAAGGFGRVVYLKTDRLGRSLKDLLEIAETLHKRDIDLVSVIDG